MLNEGNHFIGLIEIWFDLHHFFVKLLSNACFTIVVFSECQSMHGFVISGLFGKEVFIPLFLVLVIGFEHIAECELIIQR
jgi:hypothetical protein